MGEPLQIGDKVLMFTIDKKSNDISDYISWLINGSYKEVIVKKIDNILSDTVVTVIDNNKNEYCGSYIKDNMLGRHFFIRKEEFIFLLKKELNKLSCEYTNSSILKSKQIYQRLNKECNHLFVKLKDGYWTGGCHSSDCEYTPSIVECVHCGLTNKFSKMITTYGHKLEWDSYWYYKVKNDAFDDYLNNASNGKYYKGDESFINFISNKSYYFFFANKRYLKAKEINQTASNEEIFELMKEIDKTNSEKEKVNVKK